jgi:hypothetical protein
MPSLNSVLWHAGNVDQNVAPIWPPLCHKQEYCVIKAMLGFCLEHCSGTAVLYLVSE